MSRRRGSPRFRGRKTADRDERRHRRRCLRRARITRRFFRYPSEAVGALPREHLAVAVNPHQRLIAGKQLYHLLAETPGSGDLLGAG